MEHWTEGAADTMAGLLSQVRSEGLGPQPITASCQGAEGSTTIVGEGIWMNFTVTDPCWGGRPGGTRHFLLVEYVPPGPGEPVYSMIRRGKGA